MISDELFSKVPPAGLKERLTKYRHRAVVLRQIHANKVEKSGSYGTAINVAVVTLSCIVTFLGLYDRDKLVSTLGIFGSKEVAEMTFLLSAIALVTASIFLVGYRHRDDYHAHNRSVQSLTDFITDIDDLLKIETLEAEQIAEVLINTNRAYKRLTEMLPPCTDAEYRIAKQALEEKKSK